MTRLSGKKSVISPLRPAAYQIIPLIKLLKNNFNCVLIADGVGVGKTISSGYILSYFKEFLNNPSLVVCPPMLVDKWLFELSSKFDLKAIPIRSAEEAPTAIYETQLTKNCRPLVYVMASSLLSSDVSLDFENIGIVLFDEIHNYRNSSTVSHKATLMLSKKAKCRVGLSATPINNSLEDLISELSILLPNFQREVLSPAVTEFWENDPTTITLPIVTRFTKENLGIHFAKRIIKQYSVHYPSEYVELVNIKIQENREQRLKRSSFFEDVTYYRLASSSPPAISVALDFSFNLEKDPKLDLFTKIITESKSSHIITFCEFGETARYLAKNVEDRECFIITGDVPLFARQDQIQTFRQTENSILIMTPVGTEGLDLQFSDTIVNYDLHWNPMKIEQRIGRIDRVGQTKNQIFVYNLIVENSIDARVIKVLEKKLETIGKSVFETSEIISQETLNEPVLAERELIEREAKLGEGIISAVNLTGNIPECDYDVLKYVRKDYCSAVAINEAGKRKVNGEEFLKHGEESRDWLTRIDNKSKKFIDLINFYE